MEMRWSASPWADDDDSYWRKPRDTGHRLAVDADSFAEPWHGRRARGRDSDCAEYPADDFGEEEYWSSRQGHGAHGWARRGYGYREAPRAPRATSCKNCGSDIGRSQTDIDDHDGSPVALKMGALGIPVLVRSKGKSTREEGDDDVIVDLPQSLQDVYAEGGVSGLAKALESRVKDRSHGKRLSAGCPPEREEDRVDSPTYSRSYSSSYGRSHHHSRLEGGSRWTGVQPEAERPAGCDKRAPWASQERPLRRGAPRWLRLRQASSLGLPAGEDYDPLSSDLDGGHAPTAGTATKVWHAAGVVLLRGRCKNQLVHLVERANGALCFPRAPSQPEEESWLDTAIRALFEVSKMEAEHLKGVDEELPVDDACGCKYLIAEWGLEKGQGKESSWMLRKGEPDEEREPRGDGEEDSCEVVAAHWMLYTKALKSRSLSEGDKALLRAARLRFDMMGMQPDTGPARLGPRNWWTQSQHATQAVQHAPQAASQAVPFARRWGRDHMKANAQARAGACHQDGQGEPVQLRAQPKQRSVAEARCDPANAEVAGIIALRDRESYTQSREFKDVCMVTLLDDTKGFPKCSRQHREDATTAARRAWNAQVGRPLESMANMDEDSTVWVHNTSRIYYIVNDAPAKDDTPWRSTDDQVKEVCWVPLYEAMAMTEQELDQVDKELLFAAVRKCKSPWVEPQTKGHGDQSDHRAGADAVPNKCRKSSAQRHCNKDGVAWQ